MGGNGQRKTSRRTDHLRVIVLAGRVFLIRCYAKHVKTDLTVGEKKQLRQIAAHLKRAQ